jgi:ankyrin repeat protein
MADERLDSLPSTPTKVYQEILHRMNSEDREFVLKLLGWVYHARRFLKMAELWEILQPVIGPKPTDSDNNLQLYAKGNVYACGGLIVHNIQTDVVTFSDETVQEFLEKNKMANLPSHADVCKTCLTYLGFPVFEKPCLGTEWDEQWGKFKFSDYAARFWATHAKQAEPVKRDVQLETAILETFRSDDRREAMEQLKTAYWQKQKSLLHVLIENGLSRMFISHLPGGQSIDRMYASFYHSELILSLSELVFPNWAINARDGVSQTPLHYAARNEEAQVVQWLVEKDADVDAKSDTGRTPLSYATLNGCLDVVKFLMQEARPQADVNAKDEWGETPLSWAAANGRLEMVKFLVQEARPQAEVDSKDSHWGRTPLSYVAERGRLEVVQLLLETGEAEVDLKDKYGQTPLSFAAESGRLDVMKFLVQEARPRAEVDLPDQDGRTPLSYAALKGRLEVV